MPNTRYDLVGGDSHGETMDIADSIHSVDSPEATGEIASFETRGSETYVRRHYKGDEFGEGKDVFGVESDDRTETKELARMIINEGDPAA